MNLMFVCLAANLESCTESVVSLGDFWLVGLVYPQKNSREKKGIPLGNMKDTK